LLLLLLLLLLVLLVVFQIGTADDGIGNKVYINRYDSAIAEKEEDAAYATDMRTPKIPVVINENSRNLYGAPRGYKVQLNRPLLNLEPSGYDRSKALGECYSSGLCAGSRSDGGLLITVALNPCIMDNLLRMTGNHRLGCGRMGWTASHVTTPMLAAASASAVFT
jgi:hypothetical protein